jgi:cytoskeleton protein RodZ
VSAGSLRSQVADIGQALREARMRARIDITEVERATKIRARYLRALENEEWEALPGPVYVKSFLRTYSDYLGLDSRLLVDEFKRRFERPSDHEMRPVAPRRRERERIARGPLIPPWALIGAVLVLIVAALYVIGTLGASKPTPPQTSSHRTTLPRTTTAPVAPVRRPAPTTVSLRLIPTGPVYVCVADQTGKLLIPGTIYNPGQAVPLERAPALRVVLGNSAVHARMSGKPLPIAASAGAIDLLLTPTGSHPLPASQRPACK